MTLAKSVPSISDRTELTYPGGGRYFKYRTPTTPGVTAKSQPTNARTPSRRRVEAASSFPAEPSRPACRAEHASPPSWSRETKPPLHAVCLPSAARARVGDTVPRHRRAMLLRHPIPLILAAPWTTCNSAFNPLALGSTVLSAARRSHPAHPCMATALPRFPAFESGEAPMDVRTQPSLSERPVVRPRVPGLGLRCGILRLRLQVRCARAGGAPRPRRPS